ncbi:MAG: hypothetical protein LLF80_07075 [Porphyromonadaceae bacterium]|nr:hypothetical protein [Porphyromonadaceae bacterium]
MKRLFKIIFCSVCLFFLAVACQSLNEISNMSDQEILSNIEKHKPSNGHKIPRDMYKRIGATHVGGKYYLTNEPFIIEGCRKLHEMGFGVLKLWFYKGVSGYPYNSDWKLPEQITYKQLAEHPYYKTCFDMPFNTIALSVGGAALKTTNETALAEEAEMYELTKYLLQEYKDRDVEFIIHNWEGDWLIRGGTGNNAHWSRKNNTHTQAVDGDKYTVEVPADSLQRVEAMVKWFTARQKGIERARSEISNTKCRVYHAIEANRVMDSMEGIPGIINYVLPQVRVDMVSWSCYDGLDKTGLKLYRGIEYIKKKFTPSKYMKGEKKVFLGEIGIPEQRNEGVMTEELIVANWDTYVGVCLALDVPYLIHWELYCNEPKDDTLRKSREIRKTEEMRGFWLIRPDGTKSFAGKYFELLLANQGKSIQLPDK